jgi:hypothetical protein
MQVECLELAIQVVATDGGDTCVMHSTCITAATPGPLERAGIRVRSELAPGPVLLSTQA